MKNEKYVKALWDCYQKGVEKELEKKELFMRLINDAINKVTVIRLHAKWKRTGEKVKLLLIEFDNNGYMNGITVRFDNGFHKKFFGHREIELTDQNDNKIKLYSESCDSIAKRGIET